MTARQNGPRQDGGLGAAYDLSATAWANGPEAAYALLADALVARAPIPLAGARVLDLGAGTGVAGRAARAAGAATVVAADLAAAMARHCVDASGGAVAAVQADACALPFAAGAFDLVVAAMSLGHVPEPVRALREARRVAPALAASAFAPAASHPAKEAVDSVMASWGFRPPPWYEILKRDVEPQVNDADRLAALAEEAGYGEVRVRSVDVATGLDTPGRLAAWRLGMAHLAPFVATLSPADREAARRAAEDALVGAPPLVLPLLVLTAI
jgi:ubiquinone/menaquinone biosynthesis C-methylase UbiE